MYLKDRELSKSYKKCSKIEKLNEILLKLKYSKFKRRLNTLKILIICPYYPLTIYGVEK